MLSRQAPPEHDTSHPLYKCGQILVSKKRPEVQYGKGRGKSAKAGKACGDRSGSAQGRPGRAQEQDRSGRAQERAQDRSGRAQDRFGRAQEKDRSGRAQVRADHDEAERRLTESTNPVDLYTRMRALPPRASAPECLRVFDKFVAIPLPPLPCMLCKQNFNDTEHLYEHIDACHGGVQRYRHTGLCMHSLSLGLEVQ